MSSVHEIKMRMKSIKETRQITKAMKLVAAAKLKKARKLLDETLPYFDKVKMTMADILVHSGDIDSPFFDLRHEKKSKSQAFVIFSGDKGLAGGYNHNIIKLAEEKLGDFPDAVLYIAGYMGRKHFIQKKFNVDPQFDFPVQNPTLFRAREMSEFIVDKFRKGELDEVYLVYTYMHSTIKLEPHFTKLLPLDHEELMEELGVSKDAVRIIDDPIVYEPSPESVLDVLIGKYVKGILYGALVEAFTSEQSARITAMDSATSNADEMLYELNLQYNRARQTSITQEISEIVGGAAALS